MDISKIVSGWKKGIFKPLYWLEGEEEFYIDKLVNYAEHNILPESEASFNLSVFYGRDSNWADIVNVCMQYPMFSDRKVVIVKEAQHLKEIERLESYISQPLSSTVLLVAYKDKKLDARTKFARLIKEKAELISTKKIYDSALPEWVNRIVAEKGFTITPKANALLVEHIGNDLSRIESEVDKILINTGQRKSISEEDIERFVGISKEYNIFELQSAIATKNLGKAMRIVQYFGANPKAAPLPLLLPALYGFFSKVYMVFGTSGSDDATAKQIGVSPYFFKDYRNASKTYGFEGVEKLLLLLHRYNLKVIGIGAGRTEPESLLKELVVKMMM